VRLFLRRTQLTKARPVRSIEVPAEIKALPVDAIAIVVSTSFNLAQGKKFTEAAIRRGWNNGRACDRCSVASRTTNELPRRRYLTPAITRKVSIAVAIAGQFAVKNSMSTGAMAAALTL
jgi:hypothetical protein